jgi:hypothetical protein
MPAEKLTINDFLNIGRIRVLSAPISIIRMHSQECVVQQVEEAKILAAAKS